MSISHTTHLFTLLCLRYVRAQAALRWAFSSVDRIQTLLARGFDVKGPVSTDIQHSYTALLFRVLKKNPVFSLRESTLLGGTVYLLSDRLTDRVEWRVPSTPSR